MKKVKVTFYNKNINLNYDNVNKLFNTSNVSLTPKDIKSISIEYFKETKMFKTYDSERIIIRTDKVKNLIIYYGIKEFEHFEDYKNGFRKFALDNKIKLIDNVDY